MTSLLRRWALINAIKHVKNINIEGFRVWSLEGWKLNHF